jgi:predicted RNA-binding protein with TRAM domain
MPGKVANEHDGIERLEGHPLLGISVTNRGGWPGVTIQTVITRNAMPSPCLRVPQTSLDNGT